MGFRRVLVWTAAVLPVLAFGAPATADDRAFDIPLQQGQGVSGNVKLHVSNSADGDLIVTVDEATITYMPQAGFNSLDETGGNLDIQGLLLVPQFSADGAGGETRVLVPFANLQKRGATYSCTACGEGVLPKETLAGSDSVIPAMVVSGLIMFMPQENLAAWVEEPQTMSSNDVTAESSAQRLARIARAANLPIASLPNLRDLQSEDYSVLESLLDGIKDETGLDGIAKSILASAAAQAANMAYSPVLKKLVFDRFGLQSQIILKGFKANPMEYYGEASDSAGADLLKGVAIGIAGSMVADAVFSLKPLSNLPPNWKEPMRAMTKATVVETINLGTSAVDPSVAAAGIANRLYEFYQIYKASVALADTQNEAIVAAAIGLETAARLVTLNPSEKNNEIARSTISSTVANLNEAFGDGYSVAMTELVNLTFVGLLSEFRGDSDRAAQMVVHIREKGKLGADDALPDVLARPINWIASFATWSGDPPSRVAALMISSTVLNNLGQGGQAAPDIVDQAQPPVAVEAGPQPDTPTSDGVWGPDIVPKSEIGYLPCGDQKSNDACLKALGLTDAAIAFSAGISDDYSGFAFATSFQELGAVDLAVALYQGASSWYMPVLLNGQPDFVVAETTQDLFAAFRDAESRRLLGQFPNASIFETGFYNPVSSHRTLSDGTQRFTRIELVTEGCRACAPIGMAITFLDIGPATGGKILRRPIGIGYDPALPGMDLQATPQLLMETSAILQFYLNRLGYDAGSMDGRAGPQTRQALIEFQAEHCLPSTGKLDTATATALFDADGFSVPCKGATVSAETPGSASTKVGSSISSPISDGTYINTSAFGGVPGLCAEATIPEESSLRVIDGKLNFYESSCQVLGNRPSSQTGYVTLFLQCSGEGQQWEMEKLFQVTSENTFELGGEHYQGCLGSEWVATGDETPLARANMDQTAAETTAGATTSAYAAIVDGGKVAAALVDEGFVSAASIDDYRAAILAGAKIEARGKDNRTPLHYAIRFGSPSMVDLLLSSGADVSAQNIYLNTPLHWAVNVWKDPDDSLEKTRLILKAGAEVNATTAKGETPLMFAGSVQIVELLLSYSADRSIQDQNGLDASEYAKQAGRFEVADYIESAAEEVPVEDKSAANSKLSCKFDEVITEPNGCSACISSDGADRVVWTGQCKSGKIDGDGVLEWYKGKDLQWLMTASKFQSVRDGSIFTDYNVEGAYRISYLDTNGNAVTGCVPEPSGSSFKMPFVNVTVDRDFPLHREDARLAIMSKIQGRVSSDCLVGIKSVSSSFSDIDRVKIALQLKQTDVYLELNCGFQGARIDEINECFSNGNPWGRNFSQEIYNINTSREQDERVREEERLKAVETAEADAFKREMDTLKAQIDRDWNAKLAAIASNREIAVPNLADFARSNPASLISMMAPNRRISFTPRTLNMRDGKVVVAMQMSPTPIYAQIEAQVAARRTGWDQWFADIDRASRSESYNVTCLVDPSEAELFGKQRNMYVIASLVSLQGQNIVLQCSTE